MFTLKAARSTAVIAVAAAALVGATTSTALAVPQPHEDTTFSTSLGNTSLYLAEKYIKPSETAFVTSGNNYPDAIAGTPLVGKSGGSLWLTGKTGGNSFGETDVKTLGVKRIVILGGTAAVDTRAENSLKGYPGVTVERIAGVDRYDTAARIAQRAYPHAPTVLLASGQNFPDALSAGAAADQLASPVLLTDPAKLPAFTINALSALKTTKVLAIGGESAVSANVVKQLRARGIAVERVAGVDRFDTAIAVAQRFFPAGQTHAFLAPGDSFQGALIASAPAAKVGAPLLLKRATCTPASVQEYIRTSSIATLDNVAIGTGSPLSAGC